MHTVVYKRITIFLYKDFFIAYHKTVTNSIHPFNYTSTQMLKVKWVRVWKCYNAVGGGVCLMQKESMKHVHQTLEVKTKKVVRTCCNETDITREWRYVCADPMLTITA